MSTADVTVYGIVGSLRKRSWNRLLLESAARLAPEGVTVTISELVGQLPLFNEDLLGQEPPAVSRMRAEVAAADALMIATPEYNGGVPGVLKNAFDWISLPLGASVLQGKPVALIGTSPGRLGTARCQFELRNMFVFSQSPVMPGPEVVMPFAPECFDEAGHLKDPVATERLGVLFGKLQAHVAASRLEVAVR
ncbi:NADPH-dependent FMN reductase [Actinomadura sp. BRA 177]|uniref:NADPH-dependent FMN reductase n=1 Tax=Actinomadura sp. BRA 177 TaxID=2745202 RepID=UPI001595125E|nr:NAD(P)H-dependent oxidoreductase [Actinomadura sp. BRA 177]NVI88349.1 NAD(P)H-dependent oxidoreductase [Actinomadura sp. BRA 177]